MNNKVKLEEFGHQKKIMMMKMKGSVDIHFRFRFRYHLLL